MPKCFTSHLSPSWVVHCKWNWHWYLTRTVSGDIIPLKTFMCFFGCIFICCRPSLNQITHCRPIPEQLCQHCPLSRPVLPCTKYDIAFPPHHCSSPSPPTFPHPPPTLSPPLPTLPSIINTYCSPSFPVTAFEHPSLCHTGAEAAREVHGRHRI